MCCGRGFCWGFCFSRGFPVAVAFLWLWLLQWLWLSCGCDFCRGCGFPVAVTFALAVAFTRRRLWLSCGVRCLGWVGGGGGGMWQKKRGPPKNAVCDARGRKTRSDKKTRCAMPEGPSGIAPNALWCDPQSPPPSPRQWPRAALAAAWDEEPNAVHQKTWCAMPGGGKSAVRRKNAVCDARGRKKRGPIKNAVCDARGSLGRCA